MILKFHFNSPYKRRIILLQNFMQAVLNVIAEDCGKERLNYKSCFHSVVYCVLEAMFFCTG